MAFPETRRQSHDPRLDNGDEIHRLRHQLHTASVGRDQPNEVVEHLAHLLHVGLHPLQELALHLGEKSSLLPQQQIGIPGDGGHGRAELIGLADDGLALFNGTLFGTQRDHQRVRLAITPHQGNQVGMYWSGTYLQRQVYPLAASRIQWGK